MGVRTIAAGVAGVAALAASAAPADAAVTAPKIGQHAVSRQSHVSGCLWNHFAPAFCVRYSRAETVRMYDVRYLGAGSGALGAAACTPLPPGAKQGCTAIAATETTYLINAISTAYSTDRCLLLRVPSFVIGFKAEVKKCRS